ncbi:alpha/beta fold hydrolase, partial [Streptomyces sp. NPDC014894]|uniref:alpha/beta fold hydrolase n=1 Tax=Streptomyces sp. NPDC014894 TaxID=3364931 RepID=UPI00370256AA
VRRRLTRDLPDHMVPAAVIVLDRLPQTVNGKLDRSALPAPDFTGIVTDDAPRDHREETLCRLFAEVLALPRVGIHDSFFEIGGHSLLATRLIGRMETAFGVRYTIRTLFEAPTVAALAERLHSHEDKDEREDETGDPFAALLPLRPRGSRPPVFCVHPAGGLSWCYAGLMSGLDAGHPIYGLQARGISGEEERPARLADMAADYVHTLRSVQPKGPYHLLGWSYGGAVAHAMAALLREQGEEVGLLALLDSHPHPPVAGRVPEEREVLQLLLEGLGRDLGQEAGDTLDLPALLEIARERDSALAGLTVDHALSLADIVINNIRLIEAHEPPVYDGDVLFFTATESAAESVTDGAAESATERAAQSDAQNRTGHEAWTPYVNGRIENHPIACEHGEMTDPEPLREIGSVIAREMSRRASRP